MNEPQSHSTRPKRSPNAGSHGHVDTAQSARQRYDHYLALARDSALAGDRIEAENYYQHAEHYFRSAAALAFPLQKASQGQ